MTNRDLDYDCLTCGKYMYSLPGYASTERIQTANKFENRFCSEKCKKLYFSKRPKREKKVEIPMTDLASQYIEYARRNGVLK